MLDHLRPDMRYHSVFDIDLEKLKMDGITGILIDLDNTLVPWRSDEPDRRTLDWVTKTKEMGYKMCLLSNAGGSRARRTAAKLSLPVVAPARKPMRKAYINGLDILGKKAQETVMIGDQLFMDVQGAKRAGVKTILVEPIGKREFAGTRLVRIIERLVLKRQP